MYSDSNYLEGSTDCTFIMRTIISPSRLYDMVH